VWETDEGQMTVAYVLLAALAGLLGHLMRVVERGGRIKWLVAGLEACASGFVGYLAILMCKAMGLSYEWTGVIVGLLGWLGAAASVKVIEKVVRKRLGIADENPFTPEYKGDERRDHSQQG
jgi:multisubunit Na+/H+ antiporter MnhF subunit